MPSFDPKTVALAFTTYYPRWYQGKLQSIKHTDKVRGDIALEFFTKAVALGYPVVVVDGKSAKTFRRALGTIPLVRIFQRRSLKRSPSRRQALKAASAIPGVQAVLISEPEKLSLLEYVADITRPLIAGHADIVIPSRTPKEFKESYPLFQYISETEGNDLYNEYLRLYDLLPNDQTLDLFFGPRAFRNDKKILSLFLKRYHIKIGQFEPHHTFIDPEELSNAQYFPIVLALKKHLRVTGVTIPFQYPKLQKENEEVGNRALFEEKRKNQRLSLLIELMHYLSFLTNRGTTRMRQDE